MTDIMKWVGINGDKFKKMSAEEICSYYSENKDNQAICDLFKQLVFNCEILEPILKNHYNIEQKKLQSVWKGWALGGQSQQSSHLQKLRCTQEV